MILDKIVEATKIRIENCKTNVPFETMKAQAVKSENPFVFEKSLKADDMTFICEVKKASPSKGVIAEDFPFVEIAKDYERAGANAISVLTEPDFFMGSNAYLTKIKKNVKTPLLRKDFILEPYQIYEASVIGADAILLICSILDTETIKHYIEIADSMGISCLVEAHDEEEVRSAILAGARIIGVNNRDLKTFQVDLNNSIRLRRLVPKEIIFVSESGISTAADISELRDHGVDAVLIGEAFMRSKNKKAELETLRGLKNG